jgi:hypothetical protein
MVKAKKRQLGTNRIDNVKDTEDMGVPLVLTPDGPLELAHRQRNIIDDHLQRPSRPPQSKCPEKTQSSNS